MTVMHYNLDNVHPPLLYFFIYLLIINIVSFLVYGFDKIEAIRNKTHSRRVREITLLGFALIGGTIGALIAMILFRHKIKKVSFVLKFISVILVLAIGGSYYYYDYYDLILK